ALQTEPQIQEVLGIAESGHDYFLQITDARADTGGLSGATPGEAVSWGKLDPNRLPDAVTAYVDSTIALPILTAYALGKRPARPLKRLYKRRDALLEAIRAAHLDATAGAADYRFESPVSQEGVTCNFCHNVRAVDPSPSPASYTFDAANPLLMRGPYSDSDPGSAHGFVYSEIHTKGEFCAACHEHAAA